MTEAIELADNIAKHGRSYEALVIHPDDKAHGGGREEVLQTAVKPRPQVKLLSEAWAHMAKCDTDLGLTPTSRARIHLSGERVEEDGSLLDQAR